MILFSELPNQTNPNIRPRVRIGPRSEFGQEVGMAGGGKYADDFVKSVNTWWDDVPEDHWAKVKAAELDAQRGPRLFDLSGHFGGPQASIGDQVEAIRRTLQYLRRPLDRNDWVFADTEWASGTTAQINEQHRAVFRLLWASGVTGDAHIVCPWVWDGRYAAGGVEGLVTAPRTPGTCDGRTSHLMAMVVRGVDHNDHLDYLKSQIDSMRAAGQSIMAHVRGGFGGPVISGIPEADRLEPLRPEEKQHYRNIAMLLKREGVEAVLVYNCFGQGKDYLTTDCDRTARAADDNATWAAFRPSVLSTLTGGLIR